MRFKINKKDKHRKSSKLLQLKFYYIMQAKKQLTYEHEQRFSCVYTMLKIHNKYPLHITIPTSPHASILSIKNVSNQNRDFIFSSESFILF